MKKIICSFATLSLCALTLSVHAQTRSVGGQSLILDDGEGHTITIETPVPTTTYTWTLPASGPPATVAGGTINNSMLRWDAESNAWQEDTGVLSTSGGALTAGQDINSAYGTIQTNGTTRIDNAGNGTFSGLTANVVIPAGDYQVGANDYAIVDTATSATDTLPASPNVGRIVVIKYSNTNFQTSLTVDGNGNNIDGSSTYSVYAESSLELIYDGTQWDIIGGYNAAF